jgi:hypothetical protein
MEGMRNVDMLCGVISWLSMKYGELEMEKITYHMVVKFF